MNTKKIGRSPWIKAVNSALETLNSPMVCLPGAHLPRLRGHCSQKFLLEMSLKTRVI